MSADPESLFAVLAGDDHLASFHTNHVDADEEAVINADEFGGDYRVVEYTPAINAHFAAGKAQEAEAERDRYRTALHTITELFGSGHARAIAERALAPATTDAQEGTP